MSFTMAKEEKVFESLRNFGEPFKDRKGNLNVRAEFTGFLNGETKIRQAGEFFAVSNFTNLSGVTDKINELLGTDFVDDEQYNNVPANITIFTHTNEEAVALADRTVPRSRLSATVTLSTHEYNDNLYIDLTISTPYIEAPTESARAPKRKSTAELEKDDDLPL